MPRPSRIIESLAPHKHGGHRPQSLADVGATEAPSAAPSPPSASGKESAARIDITCISSCAGGQSCHRPRSELRAAGARRHPGADAIETRRASGAGRGFPARRARDRLADWLRDGFGENGAGFTAFVAEDNGTIIGMATCSRRVITGWNGPVIFLQDLFVEPDRRQHGVARALMARVAALACDLGSPIVELTVRADNPAQSFYVNTGFLPLPQCLTYVLAGPALAALAEQDKETLALTG